MINHVGGPGDFSSLLIPNATTAVYVVLGHFNRKSYSLIDTKKIIFKLWQCFKANTSTDFLEWLFHLSDGVHGVNWHRSVLITLFKEIFFSNIFNKCIYFISIFQ